MPRATKKLKAEKEIEADLRAAAREQYHKEGEIEIDEGADCSLTEENVKKGLRKGYVQAWVWVDLEDA